VAAHVPLVAGRAAALPRPTSTVRHASVFPSRTSSTLYFPAAALATVASML